VRLYINHAVPSSNHSVTVRAVASAWLRERALAALGPLSGRTAGRLGRAHRLAGCRSRPEGTSRCLSNRGLPAWQGDHYQRRLSSMVAQVCCLKVDPEGCTSRQWEVTPSAGRRPWNICQLLERGTRVVWMASQRPLQWGWVLGQFEVQRVLYAEGYAWVSGAGAAISTSTPRREIKVRDGYEPVFESNPFCP
jgi:hypothetical protein